MTRLSAMPTTVSSGGVNSSRHVEPSCCQLCIISKCLKTASVTASFNQCELLHRGGGRFRFLQVVKLGVLCYSRRRPEGLYVSEAMWQSWAPSSWECFPPSPWIFL